MVNLLRFVYEGGTYTFPPQVSLDPHNGGALTRTAKFPGTDGALDELSWQDSPTATGDMRVNWWLQTATMGGTMATLRDDVMKMSKKVGVIVADFQGSVRRIRARCNNVDMNIDNKKRAHTIQQVQASFQLTSPKWEHWPSTFHLNDGWQCSSGVILPTPQYSASISLPQTLSLTNGGNAPAPIQMYFKATPGTATAFQVRHKDINGSIINGWDWSGTLAADETLVADSRRISFKHWTSAAINSAFSAITEVTGSGFIELYPGTNTVTVAGSHSGNISLQIHYATAWR